MKKPHVLNRSMFNRGGTSAYGRGITSNLVTEEQRQRFNYGGRVRAMEGLYTGDTFGSLPNQNDLYWDWNTLKFREVGDQPDYETTKEKTERIAKEELEGMNVRPADKFWSGELDKARFGESDKYTTGPDGIGLIEKKIEATKTNGDDRTTEVMTDSDWMDLLGPTEEQKRRTKGEAQLGLAAGALDVFSQPSIAKGMKAASPHLLNLGKTATADQKAREKAVLQGKILDKVYRGREEEKGKQKRMESGDANAWEIFQASYAKDKNADKGIMVAIGETVTVLDEKDGKPIMPTGAKPGRVFRHKKQYYVTDNQGIPQPIDNIKAWLESV